MIFSVKFRKNDPVKDMWLLAPETCMHCIAEDMFVLCLRQDYFSNQTGKSLGPTPPFLYLKTDIFTQIWSKRPSQTPVVALLRHTYAPTSRKHVSTEAETRSYQ